MSIARWRGVIALVKDAVEHGSRAIERVQLDSAERPFTILEHIPPIATPTRIVHVAHDAGVKTVHGVIRGVTVAVATTADIVLARIESRGGRDD
jgi:hypothetical protein